MTHVDRDAAAAIELLTQKVDELQCTCNRLTHENEELWTALRSASATSWGIDDDRAEEDLAESVHEMTGPGLRSNAEIDALEEGTLQGGRPNANGDEPQRNVRYGGRHGGCGSGRQRRHRGPRRPGRSIGRQFRGRR